MEDIFYGSLLALIDSVQMPIVLPNAAANSLSLMMTHFSLNGKIQSILLEISNRLDLRHFQAQIATSLRISLRIELHIFKRMSQ